METTDKLVELRKQAEQAVAGMAEGDLKVKAFEVILQHLLSSRTVSHATAGAKEPPSKRANGARVPGTAKSRILLLKDEGFFAQSRTLTNVSNELKAHGWIHPQTALSGPLQSLVQERRLRRLKGKAGKKQVWTYVNP